MPSVGAEGRRLVLSVALAAAMLTRAGAAQPFERLAVHLGGAANVNTTALHRYWDRGYGGDVFVVAPFYAGHVETGVAVHRYGALRTTVPRFDGGLVFVGWGATLFAAGRVAVYGGVRLGMYLMHFDEPFHVRQRAPSESEMVVAPRIQVSVRVGEAWQLFAGAQHLHVFTARRLPLTYVGTGITHTFTTPPWLKAFLQ